MAFPNFAKGDYQQAILDFLKVPYLVTKKGKIDWTATSLYMAGQAYEKLTRYDQALLMYQQIIDRPGIDATFKSCRAQGTRPREAGPQEEGTMTLELHLEELSRSFAERTIADRAAIRLNEVIGPSLPKAVSAYLQAEVLRALERDLRTGSALRQIDRDSPGMHRLVTSFARSLSYAYTFDRENYLRALDDAVHFAANYLFRPRWTLEQFLFEDRTTVPLTSLETRLIYVTDYTYLGEILLRILRRRGAPEVTVEEVRALLEKIDDQVVQQHSPKELANLTRPIFGFMLQGDEAVDRPIPVEPLLLFFEDKKMRFLRDYLDGIVGIRKVSGLSLSDLTTLIEDLYSAEARPAAAPAGTATPPPAPEAGEMEQPPARTVTIDGTARGADRASGTSRETAPSAPAPNPQPIRCLLRHLTRRRIRPSPSTFAGMIESRAASLPGFVELITDQQRKRFVKKVFHRDADYYQTVITALEEMTDWEQASTYLMEFYRTNELDPFSATSWSSPISSRDASRKGPSEVCRLRTDLRRVGRRGERRHQLPQGEVYTQRWA